MIRRIPAEWPRFEAAVIAELGAQAPGAWTRADGLLTAVLNRGAWTRWHALRLWLLERLLVVESARRTPWLRVRSYRLITGEPS